MGVIAGLAVANLAPHFYEELVDYRIFGENATVFGRHFTFHFLINEIFMVFFFGIAAKEVTESVLPGGALNPIQRAINPIMGTLGGILGPVGLFFLLVWVFYGGSQDFGMVANGWGIPTATDIALAWLVARTVFGPGHPVIGYLLLLAVADDAIGLAIIAIFYGDPAHAAEPLWLLLVLAGMGLALAMRRARVRAWPAYVFICGPLAWSGLVLANLHPALALVFIVPFLPGPSRDTGLFIEQDEIDQRGTSRAGGDQFLTHSPLHLFESQLKSFVEFGLFFFAFANAGVTFAGIGPMTWIILASLVIGKTVGITAFGLLGRALGFPLPDRTGRRELMMAGFIAALGLTVALFVAGAAFTDTLLQGQAKMGALLSGLVGLIAVGLGRALGLRSRGAVTGGPEPLDSHSEPGA